MYKGYNTIAPPPRTARRLSSSISEEVEEAEQDMSVSKYPSDTAMNPNPSVFCRSSMSSSPFSRDPQSIVINPPYLKVNERND